MTELPALSALSYNIHHGRGEDGVLSLTRIAAEIETAGADIAGLQEADRHFDARSDWADQPAELAELLGMHVEFAPAVTGPGPSPDAPPRGYGNALLTRRPPLSCTAAPLPVRPGEEPRTLLDAVVDAGGRRLRVLNTHFTVESDASRTEQAALVARITERSAEPVVLTGDLNAEPDDPALKPLFAVLAPVGGGATYPAAAPETRIDHILTRGVRVLSARVPDTAGSDHRPVLAELGALAG